MVEIDGIPASKGRIGKLKLEMLLVVFCVVNGQRIMDGARTRASAAIIAWNDGNLGDFEQFLFENGLNRFGFDKVV